LRRFYVGESQRDRHRVHPAVSFLTAGLCPGDGGDGIDGVVSSFGNALMCGYKMTHGNRSLATEGFVVGSGHDPGL
jgi:hypothetical protein